MDIADTYSSIELEKENLEKLRTDLIKKCKEVKLKVSRIDKQISKRIKVMNKKRNEETTRFTKK